MVGREETGMGAPMVCEACKRPIVVRRDLWVRDDARFEHRACASGRDATVVLRADRERTQRWSRRAS